MGNAKSSSKPSKAPRDLRKENNNSTDTGKRHPVNRSDKPISHNARNFNKHYINTRTTNPFIMFFLQLHNKQPKEHVTHIARIAGKLWSRMTPEERKKYIDLANAEKRRREEKRKKRKHSSAYQRQFARRE